MRPPCLAIVAIAVAGLVACSFEAPDPSPPNAEPLLGCAIECHGDDTSNAPPKSKSGATATTDVAIGAHRAHLTVEPTWHRPVECADCHVVPQTLDAPGHIDGDGRAEVTFAMIAGPNASWNGTTCTTACHGSAAKGGAAPTPTWTRVDGTQATCGSCHGRPPPPPHAATGDCASCHPTLEIGSQTFRNPRSHINGVVDKVDPNAADACNSCHGSATSAAPPKDVHGTTSNITTTRGVGAHVTHLAPSNWHHQIACSACHVVPLTANAPGHLDGDNTAEVRFDSLNRDGRYTTGNATCTNLYCHGNGRGSNGTKSWIAPGALACNSCHSVTGNNMSGRHSLHLGKGLTCSQCHSAVVDASRTIINAGLHVNGLHEIKMAAGTFDASRRRCQSTGCHGTKSWYEDEGDQGDQGGQGGP